jgi:hypothetical protein
MAAPALLLIGLGFTLAAPVAGAATGWTRTPAAGVAGSSIQVASSSATLCRWEQPVDPGGSTTTSTTSTTTTPGRAADPSNASSSTRLRAAADPIVVDGTSVTLRLERDGVTVPLVNLDVTPGGAWSGSFTVPEPDSVPPGDYDLIAHCVVDSPALDGVRSFDFDPQPFTVVEGPPPTTVVAPPELIPPATATKQPDVLGTQVNRPAATANQAAAAPTLPRTGDGTLAVGLAGAGAVLAGSGALWWGARAARRPRHLDVER